MKRWMGLCAALLLVLIAAGPSGEAKGPNLGAMTVEVMRLEMEGKCQTAAIWFPRAFFIEAGVAQGARREDVERDLAALQDYEMVLVSQQLGDVFEDKKLATQEQIEARAVLVGGDGVEVKPITNPPTKVRVLAQAMQMGMEAESGDAAKAFRMLFFPASVDGKRLLPEEGRGKLILKLTPDGDWPAFEATWHTPLEALTKPNICPNAQCGESVPAKYPYCPWCGTKIDK